MAQTQTEKKPMVLYKAVRKGYIDRVIEEGDVFYFDGPKGSWMQRVDRNHRPLPDKADDVKTVGGHVSNFDHTKRGAGKNHNVRVVAARNKNDVNHDNYIDDGELNDDFDPSRDVASDAGTQKPNAADASGLKSATVGNPDPNNNTTKAGEPAKADTAAKGTGNQAVI